MNITFLPIVQQNCALPPLIQTCLNFFKFIVFLPIFLLRSGHSVNAEMKNDHVCPISIFSMFNIVKNRNVTNLLHEKSPVYA